ncbi:GGDEF domain-containing protein [Salinifilum ghardaiensis]
MSQLSTSRATTVASTALAGAALLGWAAHAVHLHGVVADAQRDPLTGCLRRDAWERRADTVLRRHGRRAAIVLVDLDGLKATNDTRGHASGDALIRAMGTTLRRVFPHSPVGRLGGDEFVVAVAGGVPSDAVARAEEFEDWSTELERRSGAAFSMGIAHRHARSTTAESTRSALMHQADLAMYRAKNVHRVPWLSYSYLDGNPVPVGSPIVRVRDAA